MEEDKKIKEITADELNKQMSHIEAAREKDEKMRRLAARTIGNADLGVSAIAYALFVTAGTNFAGGNYVSAILFLLTALLLTIVKARLPEGPISAWIKMPQALIMKDVWKVADEVRRTLRGK